MLHAIIQCVTTFKGTTLNSLIQQRNNCYILKRAEEVTGGAGTYPSTHRVKSKQTPFRHRADSQILSHTLSHLGTI